MNTPINIETLLPGNMIKKLPLKNVCSPPVKYNTDGDDRRYFITEIIIHTEFAAQDKAQDRAQVKEQVGEEVNDLIIDRVIETLLFCDTPKTRAEIHYNRESKEINNKRIANTIEYL